jgi:diguanylate cyclase (GGDEF)-like protein
MLLVSLFLAIGAVIFIPVNTYSSNDGAKKVLTPYAVTQVDEDTCVYHFRGINWKKNGTCLNFVSSHQWVIVKADDEVIFERKGVQTVFGNTDGFAWEYIEIPTNSKTVSVTLTAIYPDVRDKEMTFYQGFSTMLFLDIFKQESLAAIMSVLTLCLGILMSVYGTVAYKQSNIGRSMFYLGIFSILLSLWSCTENGIVAILFSNRAANSFISYLCLALLGTAFVMFINGYLQADDRYIHRGIIAYNLVNVIAVLIIQALGILDMKQTLITTHISMVISFLYLPFSIIMLIRKHGFSQRVIVGLASLFTMLPPMAYSLYEYYSDSHNIADYGDLFFFIFVSIYAVNVSLSLRKDLNAGKEAAIYRELAETDLLTGCYNRNAFRNDTSELNDLKDTCVVICDLNNLKRCNDTLGHALGDKYLIDSSTALKKVFKSHGKIYRVGGDEFCIIIHHCRESKIHKLVADLIEEENIYNDGVSVIKLDIACGYSFYDPDTDTKLEDIYNRADALMYENKKELKKKQPR